MGPGDLQELTAELPLDSHPSLIVGRESSDDAGVVRISDDLVLIQTVDFFTPIVDDAYTFGAIAAANALSDVYAMGGTPLTAMNVACFPVGRVSTGTLAAILRGGYDKVRESGALLVGGHTVDDVELKYGLSVTGTARPGAIMTNRAARPGDLLYLTKPVGTGVVSTAVKAGIADAASVEEAVGWMLRLNREASRCAVETGLHACTDITGFGLAGHAREMAAGSGVCLEIGAGKVPLLQGAERFAGTGYCPGGLFRNRKFMKDHVHVDPSVNENLLVLLFDPQTSGGLLLACPGTDADGLTRRLKEAGTGFWNIGRVLEGPAGTVRIVP